MRSPLRRLSATLAIAAFLATAAAGAFTGTTSAASCGSSIQDRIDATPTGGTLSLVGCTYVTSDPPTVHRAMTITGGDVTSATKGMLVLASDVTIQNMILRGPGYGGPGNDIAIQVSGASSGEMLHNVRLIGNTIMSWAGAGIHADFLTDFTFSGNRISKIWYAGIEGSSVQRGTITRNVIRHVVGTGNAYGISLARAYGSLTTDPRSSDVVVSYNVIEDIPNWEGLDTHGGQRLQFIHNTIRRVLNPIMVGASPGSSGGPEIYAPLDILVADNLIDSGVSTGTSSIGIWFSGANRGDGVLGSSRQAATGSIRRNRIIGYGLQSSGEYGAIKVSDTSGLIIVDNTITRPSPVGIQIYLNNSRFVVARNTIIDPWSDALSYAYGIYVHVDYNTGTISANKAVRATMQARTVLSRAVMVLDLPHNRVVTRA